MLSNNFEEKDNCGYNKNQRDEVLEMESSAYKCNCGHPANSTQNNLSVKIIGTDNEKFNELEQNAKDALKQLGMNTQIEHVTDQTQIEAYGAVEPPAIVINGEVAGYGKVLSKDEIVNNIITYSTF